MGTDPINPPHIYRDVPFYINRTISRVRFCVQSLWLIATGRCRFCAGRPSLLGYAPTDSLTLSELHEGARNKCAQCRMVLESTAPFSDRWQTIAHVGFQFTPWYLSQRSTRPGYVRLTWIQPRGQYQELEVEIKVSPGQRFDAPVNSQSEECIERIRCWTDKCLHDHKGCSTLQPDGRQVFLPDRLVEVDPPHWPHDDNGDVRLVLSSDIVDRSAKYAALSYCWGSKQQRTKPIPKLTPKTRQDRLARIHWTELTRTFQDAITLARRLSLAYIWIDALCIIQDDEADFASQASQMSYIYGRACLVISATRGVSSDVGLFHDRPRSHRIDYEDEQGTGTSTSKSTTLVREWIPHEDFRSDDPRSHKRAPVFTRGWCFQERLLARRLVHFAERELVFECNQDVQCECGFIGPDFSHDETIYNFKLRLARGTRHNPSVSKRHELWWMVLFNYTARSLAFESDRLPAISGFAQTLVTEEMGRYLAGLWENELPTALLWQVSGALQQDQGGYSRRPSAVSVPTWSWSSIQGRVAGFTELPERATPVARILEVLCTPASADLYGAVQPAARISLRAPVLTVTLLRPRADPRDWLDRFAYQLERDDDKGFSDHHPFYADVCLDTERTPDYVPAGSRVLCVVIEYWRYSEYTHGHGHGHDHCHGHNQHPILVPWCLVLKKAEPEAAALSTLHTSSDYYTRIGCVRCPPCWFYDAPWGEVTIL